MSNGIVLSLCDFTGAWSRPFINLGYTVVRVDPMHDAGRATTEGTTLHGSGRLALSGAENAWNLAMTAGQLADRLANDSRFLMNLPGGYARGIVGVLMAPPCTHYSSSGARHWPAKDADGRTEEANAIVRDCLRVKDLCKPDWWALENPVGRIARLVPELAAAPSKFYFDPCEFAGWAENPDTEAYTKRTVLWGDFDAETLALLKDRREPVMVERKRKDGSIVRGSWMWANLGGKSERTKALRSKTPEGFATAFAVAQHRQAVINKQVAA